MAKRVFNPKDYSQYIVNIKGKEYLMVAGQVKAAHDLGIFISSETTSIDLTPTHLRVMVRVTLFNRDLYEEFGDRAEVILATNPQFFYQYADGASQAPLERQEGDRRSVVQLNAMLEDLETSATGRALAKLGFVLGSMATADEIKIAEERLERKGNRQKLAKLLGSSKITELDKKTLELVGKKFNDLDQSEISALIQQLGTKEGF